MAKDTFHVVPQGDQWAVKKVGSDRPDSTHTTQREAIDSAQELARDGDAIVIHRSDGTIRGRFTYSEDAAEKNGNGRTTTEDSRERQEVKPEDVMSVGKRVSWSAILAGAVVALATYAALMSLATAIGITTRDMLEEHPRTYVLFATGIAMFCLLASLFLGGFVASRATVGENKLEAVIYGLLVWGVLIIFAMAGGNSLANTMARGYAVWQNNNNTVANQTFNDEQVNRLNLNDEQRKAYDNLQKNNKDFAGTLNLTPEQRKTYGNLQRETRNVAESVNPTIMAWLGFAAVVLSILAAVLGAVEGAGPELFLQQVRTRRGLLMTRVAVANPNVTRSPVEDRGKIRV